MPNFRFPRDSTMRGELADFGDDVFEPRVQAHPPPELLTLDGRLKVDAQVTVPPVEVALPDFYPLPPEQVQIDALTNAQLRASPVQVLTELDSKPLNAALNDLDMAVITHSVIQGRTTGQGGGFHDVKVTPSGALTVEADVVGTVSVAGTVQIAEPVTVEGTVNVGNFPAQIGLTDAQLRATPVGVNLLNQLVPATYNQVTLGYTGENVTQVEYRNNGVLVATLTLSYNGANLVDVVRT